MRRYLNRKWLLAVYVAVKIVTAVEAFAFLAGFAVDMSHLDDYRHGPRRSNGQINADVFHSMVIGHAIVWPAALLVGVIVWIGYRAWKKRQWTQ